MKIIKSKIVPILIVLAFIASFTVPLSICDSFLKPIKLIGSDVNQNLEKYLSIYLAIYFGYFILVFIAVVAAGIILLPQKTRILYWLIAFIALTALCVFGYSSYYKFDKSSSLNITNDLLYDIDLLNKSKDTQTSTITVASVSVRYDNGSFGDSHPHYSPLKYYVVCSTDLGEEYYFLISKEDEAYIRNILDNPSITIIYFVGSGFIKEII